MSDYGLDDDSSPPQQQQQIDGGGETHNLSTDDPTNANNVSTVQEKKEENYADRKFRFNFYYKFIWMESFRKWLRPVTRFPIEL